jgi:hypothetical protein
MFDSEIDKNNSELALFEECCIRKLVHLVMFLSHIRLNFTNIVKGIVIDNQLSMIIIKYKCIIIIWFL